MGGRAKRHDRPRGKSRGSGGRPARREQKNFLLVTNGAETEREYFERIKRSFRGQPNRRIDIVVHNSSPKNLATFALDRAVSGYECVAVVFDKDHFDCFDEAVALLKKPRSIDCFSAYSNECFELWMLLHFQELSSGLGRDTLRKKLEDKIKEITKRKSYRYDKSGFDFGLLDNPGDLQQAIRRAKRMLEIAEEHNPEHPWRTNPSTEVHLLMKKLQEFMTEQ